MMNRFQSSVEEIQKYAIFQGLKQLQFDEYDHWESMRNKDINARLMSIIIVAGL